MVVHAMRRQRQRGAWACRSVRLANSVSSGFCERPCSLSQKKSEGDAEPQLLFVISVVPGCHLRSFLLKPRWLMQRPVPGQSRRIRDGMPSLSCNSYNTHSKAWGTLRKKGWKGRKSQGWGDLQQKDIFCNDLSATLMHTTAPVGICVT